MRPLQNPANVQEEDVSQGSPRQVFEALLANRFENRLEVQEKRTILDMLKTKRILDAFASVACRERGEMNKNMEAQFTQLALEFRHVSSYYLELREE